MIIYIIILFLFIFLIFNKNNIEYFKEKCYDKCFKKFEITRNSDKYNRCFTKCGFFPYEKINKNDFRGSILKDNKFVLHSCCN